MLTIDRIVLREIGLPLREPFRISSGEIAARRILLVETTTTDGLRAWSECVAGEQPNYSAETIDTAWHALRAWFAPRPLGRELTGPECVDDLLARDVRGHRMARAALEMGTWALAAQRAGDSLARTLGGQRDRIPVGVSLGIQATPAALAQRAETALREGYRKIKLKIQPGADLAFVAAVREALGPPLPSWSTRTTPTPSLTPTTWLASMTTGLLMIEQPLEHEDLVRRGREALAVL